MFEKVAQEAKTLTEFYSYDQRHWCSDLQQREKLEDLVGISPVDTGIDEAITQRDEQWKTWLGQLPVDERWILERHSGLWGGRTNGPPPLKQIAVGLHVGADTCTALWQAALARLKEIARQT